MAEQPLPQVQVAIAGCHPGTHGATSLPVRLAVAVAGPPGVETVALLRDGKRLHLFDPRGAQRLSPHWLRVAWQGPPGPGWDGYLEVTDNQISSAAPYGMRTGGTLHPLGPRRVGWSVPPTPEAQGVILRLASSSRGALQFITPRATLAVSLTQFRGRRLEQPGNDPRDRVALCRMPDLPPPAVVQVEWLDREPPPGAHTYEVRVLLTDGRTIAPEPVHLTVTPASGH